MFILKSNKKILKLNNMALLKKIDGTTWIFFAILVVAVCMVTTALISRF